MIIYCYRCGADLEKLTLPLSRLDECPSCTVSLHVCRMCVHFDRNVAKQCREDDAEEVLEKERPNFCEWFKPSDTAFDPATASEQQRAEKALKDLFGEADGAAGSNDDEPDELAKLFK